MDFSGARAAIRNWFSRRGFGRLLVAFYGDAVITAILIFFSRNAIPTAIRTFLGSSF
jgi:hypothetical protein